MYCPILMVAGKLKVKEISRLQLELIHRQRRSKLHEKSPEIRSLNWLSMVGMDESVRKILMGMILTRPKAK